MSRKTCKLFIDEEPYSFDVKGDFFWGKEELLFKNEDNIISKTDWKDKGFAIVNAFLNEEFETLKQSITTNIIKAFKANNLSFNETTFTLDKYHQVVTDNQTHNKIIDVTRNLENKDFDFNIDALAKRFGDFLGYELTSYVEELKKSHIQIRISRPNSLDINPPHRDGYLSYWENIINVWVPIIGCTKETSLPVCVGSHLIPENKILRTQSKGAEINGNVYYVPCILETKDGPIKMIRPNPTQGEALIFTPYLIHGAAVNKSKNKTRVALELRFPKVK